VTTVGASKKKRTQKNKKRKMIRRRKTKRIGKRAKRYKTLLKLKSHLKAFLIYETLI